MEFYETFPSPLGDLFITFSGKALTGVLFERPRMKAAAMPGSFRKQLRDYFEGKLRDFDQNILFTSGTDFEQKVWLALKEIPYGGTRSYKWLAERIQSPNASRAVGQALSKNPIPIVLPCHRVIESQGKLGGYSSGEDIKRRLLSLEYYHSEQEEN
jgi:methylated-DNA-[protein]-cysteine S-methyltransferase